MISSQAVQFSLHIFQIPNSNLHIVLESPPINDLTVEVLKNSRILTTDGSNKYMLANVQYKKVCTHLLDIQHSLSTIASFYFPTESDFSCNI